MFMCVAFSKSTMLVCDFPEVTHLQTELLPTPEDSYWKKQLLLDWITKTTEEWAGQEGDPELPNTGADIDTFPSMSWQIT